MVEQAVAPTFGVPRERLWNRPKGRRPEVFARQVAMYLAKQMTTRSLPEIGRRFGGRDHTTIMHGIRKVEELRAQDSQLAEDLDLLRRLLEA